MLQSGMRIPNIPYSFLLNRWSAAAHRDKNTFFLHVCGTTAVLMQGTLEVLSLPRRYGTLRM